MNHFFIFHRAPYKIRPCFVHKNENKKLKLFPQKFNSILLIQHTNSDQTMADFLGNLLGSMAGPPKASDKEIMERKKARELAKKIEMRNKQESKEFKLEIEKRIEVFLKLPIGDENRRTVFEPMPKGVTFLCNFDQILYTMESCNSKLSFVTDFLP